MYLIRESFRNFSDHNFFLQILSLQSLEFQFFSRPLKQFWKQNTNSFIFNLPGCRLEVKTYTASAGKSLSNRAVKSRSYFAVIYTRSNIAVKKFTRMSSGGRLRQGKTYTASAGKSPLSSFRSQVPVHHPEVKTASPEVSSSNKIRSPLTKFKNVEEPC